MTTEDMAIIEDMIGQAIGEAGAIENEDRRRMLIEDLKAALAKSEHTENEIDFDSRRDAAMSISDPYERSSALREVAEDMAKAGLYTEAAEIRDRIEDYYMREWTSIIVAKEMGQGGSLDDALSNADNIADIDYRARALCAVAVAMIRNTDPRAAQTLSKAFDAAKGIDDPFDAVWVLCDIGRAAAKLESDAGNSPDVFAEAMDRVHYICHTIKRASAFRAIGEAMWKAGDDRYRDVFGTAVESAESLGESDNRTNALGWVAAAMKKAGDARANQVFARAMDSLDDIKKPESRARAQRWLAGAMAEGAEFRTAASLAGGITSRFYRNEAYKDIASTMAAAGESALAAKAVSMIKELVPRMEALKEVAAALPR